LSPANPAALPELPERTPPPAGQSPAGASGGYNPLYLSTPTAGNFLSDLTQALTAAVASVQQNQPSPQAPSGQRLKVSDLPSFKGNSLDGGEAEAFLEQIETIFCLYNTREEDKGLYTSLAFPADTPARAWFLEQKHLGRFRDDTDKDDVVIYRYLVFQLSASSRGGRTPPYRGRYIFSFLIHMGCCISSLTSSHRFDVFMSRIPSPCLSRHDVHVTLFVHCLLSAVTAALYAQTAAILLQGIG
jgi:hypothetical protein